MSRKSRKSIDSTTLPHCAKYNPKASVKETKNRGKQKWQVTVGWDVDGKPVRLSRTDKNDALALAKQAIETAEMIARGINETIATAQQSYEFLTAKEVLKPFNVSVVAAAEFYAKCHQGVKHIVTVEQAFKKWGEWHDPVNGNTPRSESYVQSMMESYLKPFAKIYGHKNLIDLEKKDFEEFLYETKKNLNATSKLIYKRKLNLWLNWCKKKDYFPNDIKPLDGIEFGNLSFEAKTKKENAVLDPKLIGSMLKYSVSTKKVRDLQTGIVIAIRAFVGPRAKETRMLRYRVMNEVESKGVFRIKDADHVKTFPRPIELKANAREWLLFLMNQYKEKPHEDQYIVWDRRNASKPLTDNGWKQHWTYWLKKWKAWAIKNDEPHGDVPTNSLRNTFASCALELFGAEYTLQCMGQSNFQTLKREYLNYRSKDQALALFGLKTPDQIQLEEQQQEREAYEMDMRDEAIIQIGEQLGEVDDGNTEGFFDQFKVDGQWHEMSDFYAEDYRPQNHFEDYASVDYLSASKEEIDAYEKQLAEMPKEHLEFLKRHNEWFERMEKKGRKVPKELRPHFDYHAVKNGIRLLHGVHESPAWRGPSN